MKVLLIYPNTMMATLVPIHMSLLSACLKSKGFEVDLFDTTFYKAEEGSFEQKRVELLQIKPFDFEERGVKLKYTNVYDDLRKKIVEFKPDLIGITIVEDTKNLAFSLLDKIKDFDIPVIAGGVYVTFSPKEVIGHRAVNMVCLGEGEEALVELCQKMAEKEDYSTVKNIWVKKDGKVIKNSLRPLADINKLPYIDYSLFGKERLYRPMFGKIYTMIQIEIDRGCPYDCTYCAAPQLRKLFQDNNCGFYYRRKNIDRLFAEMKYLVAEHRPDYLNFDSETFLAKPIEELKEFARRYKEIGLPFWCQTRPETITEEKIKILKEMNCNNISCGVEHGNEEFRRRLLNRQSSNKQIIDGLSILAKHNISYSVNNIIGFPEETRELIFDTIRLNRQIDSRTANVLIFVPYKGTFLYNLCIEKGYLDKDAPTTTHSMIEGTKLKTQPVGQQELKGLQRTFNLYVKFPELDWDKIKIAEKFDEQGNRMFEELKKIYQEKYF